MTGAELRARFLGYFQERGHTILPSASLIPEGDASVLFTTAGMQPLVPYLLGAGHPGGTKLANAQKCLRTGDLEAVGDAFHLTFFEMLGNWSLGDYGKEEAIALSYEFLVSDRWLGIPKRALAITCFAGDVDAPRDEESARLWQRLGIPKDRIWFFGKKDNWWEPSGQTGPCGPDTEMFFDTGRGSAAARPGDDSGRFVEIWNDVFMEYEKRPDGTVGPLRQKNVDTGMGLERTVAVLNDLPTVYETDLLAPLLEAIRSQVSASDERPIRIAADHLRAAVFVLADPRGVTPSNVEQGYVVRRLIRRGLRSLRQLGANDAQLAHVLTLAGEVVAQIYGTVYPEVSERSAAVAAQLAEEVQKYLGVEQRAEKILEQQRAAGRTRIQSAAVFAYYQETGVHPDLLQSLAPKYGIAVDVSKLEAEIQKHQAVSRAGVAQRFAGGLADHSDRTVRLHTATHLLHAALRRVLGPHVEQRGSNITPERLRFDFAQSKKIEPSTLAGIERLVNEQIARDLPVTKEVTSLAAALASGALGFFGERYGAQVNVYRIGDFSKEICGGPHVARTGLIGRFRIVKEEGLAAGIRRIRAVVEDEQPR